MKFLVYLLELLIGDVGVDLGGGDGGVAEHALDAADVGSIGKQIGGKTVAQGVRMNIFDKTCFGSIKLDDSLN